MAEQTGTTPESTPPPPAPPKADVTAATATSANASASKPDDSPRSPSAAEKDSMPDLLGRMERMHVLLQKEDPGLAERMQKLAQQGAADDRRVQPGFRNSVAYTLQDLEKSAVGPIAIAPDLRQEMTSLAGSAPGLENERMLALMRTTASLENGSLVREIRQVGSNIAQQVDQRTPDTDSRIDALENKVRLSQRPSEPTRTAEVSEAQSAKAPETVERRTEKPSVVEDSAQAARQYEAAAQARAADDTRARQVQVTTRPVLDTILAALRPPEPRTSPPWEPPHTPIAERLARHERATQEESDQKAFVRAEVSGRTALNAMQAFTAGEGATVMSRINAAARANPDGMSGVLSEMREGGRFSDLRMQFNNALEKEKGVAQAYLKASAALSQYGVERSGVEAIISRRPDAIALTARFEKMDAEIAGAASSTPSRKDGQSMLEDFTQKTAELLQRAVDSVKAVFSRAPAADASARPAPSPSMSA